MLRPHLQPTAATISSASHEQAQGITQINTAVGQMEKVTQSNAANAEEGAAASEELNAQAESMKEAVSDLVRLVDGTERKLASSGAAGAPARPPVARRAAARPLFKPARVGGNGDPRSDSQFKPVPRAPLATLIPAGRRAELS